MTPEFDIGRFKKSEPPTNQYERQLKRLTESSKEVVSVEEAVRGAVRNIAELDGRSFVIYGEPQSGKTEMMICLTAKLLDEGYEFILHLLNDSVDLLGQNLGRFKSSGLAPAARNFSEILDPAVNLKGQRHVIFCKKNGSDLRKLIEKIGNVPNIVVIDDEADYASPNAKINSGIKSPINDLITQILGNTGIYAGVTATPARLDLNNTFDNDSRLWVNFPPHSKYTGQDVFFPLESPANYYRTLLPDSGSDPKYARQALFSFLVNAAYLNQYVNAAEKNYSILVHTSGKKADHKSDWNTMHDTLVTLVTQDPSDFEKYTRYIWELCRKRYPDADADLITRYILDNVARHAIIILNSERDWKDNSSAATNPTSLFTIIIGGNIVSRGVTLENLLSMFFTRDVQHKIQQDTYIQRARMFGSRGDYLHFFELTIPQSLYLDWHRCFDFHRLALDAMRHIPGQRCSSMLGHNNSAQRKLKRIAHPAILALTQTLDLQRKTRKLRSLWLGEPILDEGLCLQTPSYPWKIDMRKFLEALCSANQVGSNLAQCGVLTFACPNLAHQHGQWIDVETLGSMPKQS